MCGTRTRATRWSLNLAELKERLGTIQELTEEQWAWALLLGVLRERTNANRHRSSDRGADGNRGVDLHGALGELLLYGKVRQCSGSEVALRYMENHLYRTTGGKQLKGPDLSFQENGHSIGVDVKTFDCKPNKRYFAVNDRKHAELAGQCEGYMALVCPSFATRACVASLVPYGHVSRWECRRLRANGPPSRNMPMDRFMNEYGVKQYSIEASREVLHDERTIRSLALKTGRGSASSGLLKLLPDIRAGLQAAQQSIRDESGGEFSFA